MQLFVKTLTGETITLEVESSYTVKDIVVILEDKKGYTSETMNLIFAGRQITDHRWKTAEVGRSL
jgi:ubiquitin